MSDQRHGARPLALTAAAPVIYAVWVRPRLLSWGCHARFLRHPSENRFSGDRLMAELENHGLQVGVRRLSLVQRDFIVGVAERLP